MAALLGMAPSTLSGWQMVDYCGFTIQRERRSGNQWL